MEEAIDASVEVWFVEEGVQRSQDLRLSGARRSGEHDNSATAHKTDLPGRRSAVNGNRSVDSTASPLHRSFVALNNQCGYLSNFGKQIGVLSQWNANLIDLLAKIRIML